MLKDFLANAAKISYRSLFGALSELKERSVVSKHGLTIRKNLVLKRFSLACVMTTCDTVQHTASFVADCHSVRLDIPWVLWNP